MNIVRIAVLDDVAGRDSANNQAVVLDVNRQARHGLGYGREELDRRSSYKAISTSVSTMRPSNA